MGIVRVFWWTRVRDGATMDVVGVRCLWDCAVKCGVRDSRVCSDRLFGGICSWPTGFVRRRPPVFREWTPSCWRNA